MNTFIAIIEFAALIHRLKTIFIAFVICSNCKLNLVYFSHIYSVCIILLVLALRFQYFCKARSNYIMYICSTLVVLLTLFFMGIILSSSRSNLYS